MKFPLHLLTDDWIKVLSVMEDHKEKLESFEADMFEIAYQNVYNHKEHDGMSFKYIITALEESESNTDDLILLIKHSLQRHQKINGPRNKGRLLSRTELLSLPLREVMQIAN
jgi:hypothetical protein